MEQRTKTSTESFKVLAYTVSALTIGLFYYLASGYGAVYFFVVMALCAIPPFVAAYRASDKNGRGQLSTAHYIVLITVYLLVSAFGFPFSESNPAIFLARFLTQFVLMYVLICSAIWFIEHKKDFSTPKRWLILLASVFLLGIVTALVQAVSGGISAKLLVRSTIDELKNREFPISMRDGTVLNNVMAGDGSVIVMEYSAPPYMSFSDNALTELKRKSVQNYCENMKPLMEHGVPIQLIYEQDTKTHRFKVSPVDCK